MDYLNPKSLAGMASQGGAFLKQHEPEIIRIERETGVDRYILVAIWGRETAYGTAHDTRDAIQVLAT